MYLVFTCFWSLQQEVTYLIKSVREPNSCGMLRRFDTKTVPDIGVGEEVAHLYFNQLLAGMASYTSVSTPGSNACTCRPMSIVKAFAIVI